MLSYMPDTVKIKLYVTVLFRLKLGMLITNQWSELFCNIPTDLKYFLLITDLIVFWTWLQ